MAITSSAKKAHRSSLRKRVFNVRRKNAIQDAMKAVRVLVTAKKFKEAAALLPNAYQALDKAAKTHTIDRGTADRKKSRLAHFVSRAASVK